MGALFTLFGILLLLYLPIEIGIVIVGWWRYRTGPRTYKQFKAKENKK